MIETILLLEQYRDIIEQLRIIFLKKKDQIEIENVEALLNKKQEVIEQLKSYPNTEDNETKEIVRKIQEEELATIKLMEEYKRYVGEQLKKARITKLQKEKYQQMNNESVSSIFFDKKK